MYLNQKFKKKFELKFFLLSWAPNQPDNSGGSMTNLVEGCGEMAEDGLNDAPCSVTRRYICEVDII